MKKAPLILTYLTVILVACSNSKVSAEVFNEKFNSAPLHSYTSAHVESEMNYKTFLPDIDAYNENIRSDIKSYTAKTISNDQKVASEFNCAYNSSGNWYCTEESSSDLDHFLNDKPSDEDSFNYYYAGFSTVGTIDYYLNPYKTVGKAKASSADDKYESTLYLKEERTYNKYGLLVSYKAILRIEYKMILDFYKDDASQREVRIDFSPWKQTFYTELSMKLSATYK